MTRARPRAAGPEATPTFCGIDPGKTGAIAWINPDRTAGARPTPILDFTSGKWDFDKEEMIAILADLGKSTFVAIERVNAAPMRGRRQGANGMFGFGKGYGLWLGFLGAMAIPYFEVDPRKWKAAILSGTAKDKAAAICYARTFFPTVNLLARPRSRKPDTGICDALCLAEYARQAWKVRQLLEAKP